MFQWMYQVGCDEFGPMSNISKSLQARLNEHCDIRAPEIVSDHCSQDGTRKWLLRLEDGNCIETVYIPELRRTTLCVSSQVGCSLNCRFCYTAQQGFNRNLGVHEIIGQLWVAQRLIVDRKISNVVFMGMGEPLLNYDNVVTAIRIMLDDFSYGLSRRRVTLSTAGIIPGMLRLKDDCPVSLALSLHATTDAVRSDIVPLNKKYPIAQLLEACKSYVEGAPRKRVTFEYVMLDQVNDSPEDAQRLIHIMKNVPAKLNLIPFNPFPGTSYQTSSAERVQQFKEIIGNAGYTVTVRKTRGDDIVAACGQLAGQVKDRTKRSLQIKTALQGTSG